MINLEAKLKRIKFSVSPTRAGRIHYLTAEDVRVLLSRLPEELWHRLRAVHFNDRSRGRRVAGYVNMGYREIAICAFPASVSCVGYTARKVGTSPRTFGASRGKQWSKLAVRRFLLYDTFLHELGHLQIVDPEAKNLKRRFASETLAHKFANDWRRKLWSRHFDHPDPVHNPPKEIEFEEAIPTSGKVAQSLRKEFKNACEIENHASTVDLARKLLEIEPKNAMIWVRLAEALEKLADYEGAILAYRKALKYCSARKRFPITAMIALIFEAQEDYKGYERWARTMIKIRPDHASGYIFLGSSLARQGKFIHAENAHRNAVTCKKGLIDEAYLNLGLVLRAQGRLHEARECLLKALEINPNYEIAKEILVDVDEEIGSQDAS